MSFSYRIVLLYHQSIDYIHQKERKTKHISIVWRFNTNKKMSIIHWSFQANFGAQQQYFFDENQHLCPSPRSFSIVFKQPLGHELPTKQNGAMPYHLQRASFGWGTMLKNKRITIVLVNIDEGMSIKQMNEVFLDTNNAISLSLCRCLSRVSMGYYAVDLYREDRRDKKKERYVQNGLINIVARLLHKSTSHRRWLTSNNSSFVCFLFIPN